MGFDLTGIGSILDFGTKIIDRVIPDPQQAADAKLKLLELQSQGDLAQLAADTDIIKAGAGVVQTEAASTNWLAASWRPVLMLVFGGLIVARWFGWSTPGLSQAEALELWSIVKIGIGGYVIGRSVEKTAPGVVGAITGAIAQKS